MNYVQPTSISSYAPGFMEYKRIGIEPDYVTSLQQQSVNMTESYKTATPMPKYEKPSISANTQDDKTKLKEIQKQTQDAKLDKAIVDIINMTTGLYKA